MFKKLGTSLILFFIIILISTFLLTIFNYFDILSANLVKILKFGIMAIAIFISAYKLGMKSEKKGYLEGIKFGGIIIIIFLAFIILVDEFSFKSLLYYLIIMLISIIGSMLGINKKKDN